MQNYACAVCKNIMKVDFFLVKGRKLILEWHKGRLGSGSKRPQAYLYLFSFMFSLVNIRVLLTATENTRNTWSSIGSHRRTLLVMRLSLRFLQPWPKQRTFTGSFNKVTPYLWIWKMSRIYQLLESSLGQLLGQRVYGTTTGTITGTCTGTNTGRTTGNTIL